MHTIISNSLLPVVEHLGMFGYWLILLVSLLESLAFVGLLIPGTIMVLFSGFLSAQGYLDLGDLIWFTAIGGILGDGISYWLGTKGKQLFRNNSKVFKERHIERAERFFKKHGNKSIFLGRFIGPLRPIVPFMAGLSKMDKRTFFVWNVASAFSWAATFVFLGYFLGGIKESVERWTTRAGLFALGFIVVCTLLWFLFKKSADILLFVRSVAVSIKEAVLLNPDVRKLHKQHPGFFAFINRRLHKGTFSGLPLTLLSIAFIYVLALFLGIIQDIIASDPIVAFDVRVANFFFTFRSAELVTFFTWVTLLGDPSVVMGEVVLATLVLWFLHKKEYIVPLWLTVIGSELFAMLGKMIIHRPRPPMAYDAVSGFSFPSGHATIAVAWYGFAAYIFFRESQGWRRRTNIFFIGLLIILLIGLSRLYLDVHYVSDVWGGYLSGLLWLIIGIAITELFQKSERTKL